MRQKNSVKSEHPSVYLHTDICNHVSVLNCAGLVQVTPDGETLVVENHHAHHVRSVLQQDTLELNCLLLSDFY